MEVMKVYNEVMATWIIARVTSGKCEGAAFVFGLIESAIRKEATEILLTPVQELDMVRMDFGRPHCYYPQPDITRAQFAYLTMSRLSSSTSNQSDPGLRFRTRCTFTLRYGSPLSALWRAEEGFKSS